MELSSEQIAEFQEQGFLIVRGLFDRQRDLAPVIAEYEGVLDSLAHELFARGEIKSTYADLPFSERVIAVYRDSGRVHAQYFDFSLPLSDVKPDTPFWTGPAVFNTMRNKGLLDAVTSLIGPEIYSNPVQHVRIKPPERLTPKGADGKVQLGASPVHQDNGVVLPVADQTQMLTVWFPLWDATIKNGCLVVFPGSHRNGLIEHCPVSTVHIPGRLVRGKAVSLPMAAGDVLFLHRLTMHASHANKSDAVRWSFDLRYNPIGQPTGREAFPGFVARSAQHPERELRDPAQWTQLWVDARARLSGGPMGKLNRWRADAAVCA